MITPDPGQLEALAAAVSEGTFDAAARVLHVTPSAISQRVKALETSIGRVLVTRTRPVQPTPSGQTLLRLARQIQILTADVSREIDGETAGAVTIPLAVNADSLATWLLPALVSVTGSVVYDLRSSDQERTAELLRQGVVMAAITGSAGRAMVEPVPGCSVERLGRMRYRPAATPAFVAQWFADGVTPDELARAPVVVFDRDDTMQDTYLRRRTRRRIDPPRHHVPASAAFLEAVRLGVGWGMLPDLQSGPIEDQLVFFDPRGTTDVRLFWQQWRLRSQTLDRVAAAVRTAAAAALR
jgi:LysR family transcriptional regulator (chromosome initiation inhibitor)